MGLFRKRKMREAGSGIRAQLQVKIGVWFRAREKSLADYLNQKTRAFNFRQWLVLLISFCLGVSGYLLYLLLGIFN